MKEYYDIFLDDISCVGLSLFPTKRPDIPAPQEKIKEYAVLGIDGKLYEKTGFYDDLEIPVEFNYWPKNENWFSAYARYKKIILSCRKLRLKENNDFYFKIKKVSIGTNQRISRNIGRFSVTFTVDPYYYLMQGLKKYAHSSVTYNRYDSCRPIYIIEGEGTAILKVNEYECICNVGQNLIINTELMISYKEDGTNQNTAVSCDYDDLCLVPGSNTIEISNGFTLNVIPNWRMI